jgi:hypothetical protein
MVGAIALPNDIIKLLHMPAAGRERGFAQDGTYKEFQYNKENGL